MGSLETEREKEGLLPLDAALQWREEGNVCGITHFHTQSAAKRRREREKSDEEMKKKKRERDCNEWLTARRFPLAEARSVSGAHFQMRRLREGEVAYVKRSGALLWEERERG